MNRAAHPLVLAWCVAAAAAAADPVAVKIQPKAMPFPLDQVRLLAGPLHHAMELDRRYLLSLEVDRLLHNFRITAGLPSSATPLGGWEAPKCELRGHFVGHYLSASALMVAATGDAELKEKADRVVAGLAECQAAMKSGYLSAFPEEFIDRVEACKPVWAPWYTLHKIYAGLLDMDALCGNRQAIEVARKAADWVQRRCDKLSDEQVQKMLRNEHGGMNDVLAELAAITGEPKYLTLAARFNHHAVLDPLAHREDRLTGLHANTQFPKILGAARQYELTGDESLRTIATFFWDTVVKERSYVTGGNSLGEHFTPKGHLSKFLGPTTTETCNTYNMRKITRRIFCWDPKAEYADYDERALYNHILASQNPETGMVCYFVPLQSGLAKAFSTPLDAFWCCVGTGVENHAKYGDSIYFHDGGKVLYLNLFIASELTWPEKGVTIRQETKFPEDDKVRLTFTCRQPVELELRIRHPAWAHMGLGIALNGQGQPDASKPGSYATISRAWQTGDVLDLALPMRLRAEAMEDDPRKVAILYGPILLCGEVADPADVPVIFSEDGGFLARLEPLAGQPLVFTGPPALFRTLRQQDQGVRLLPFYKKYNGPYVVYWDVVNSSGWEAKLREREAELAREKALEARTVDLVRIGDAASERAHKLQGERHGAGEFHGRNWRHATGGGWFSYEVKVEPDKRLVLCCTYWGSDVGGRQFDVLVDGTKIATQKLDNNRPGKFYDEVYAIPADVVQGKSRVTVRLQGHPGKTAGGIFGLRLLRKE